MIHPAAIAADFEEIIGWPYPPKQADGSYGAGATNDQGKDPAIGIDCSGAFVRAYRKHGESIYHGSNTIFRKHCTEVGRINGDASLLRVGMAVFKQRMDGGEPSKYHGDGYGNMYHMGLVTSVNPLRIVHATPPVAKADTTLGTWAWYGLLDKVAYDSESGEEGGTVAAQQATVVIPATSSKRYAYLRGDPSTSKPYIAKVPEGTTLTVQERGSEWCTVTFAGKRGYMQMQYLQFADAPDDGTEDGDTLAEQIRALREQVDALNAAVFGSGEG